MTLVIKPAKVNWQELASIIGLCLFAAGTIAYVGLAGFNPDDPGINDNREYYAMWADGGSEVQKPFHWRVIVPFLAQLIPAGFEVSFGVINIAAMTVAGVALYYLLKGWGAESRASLIGVALFYLSHTVLRFGGIPLVESPALAIMFTAMLAAERCKWLMFLLVVTVGMFVKETTAIMLMYPWLMAGSNVSRLRWSAFALPGIAAYAVFRFVVAPVEVGYGYSLTAWFENLVALFVPNMESLGDWRAIVLSLGIVWVFLFMGLRSGGLVPRRYALFIAACFLSALALSTDFERVIFLSFPIALAFALPALERALGVGNLAPTPSTARHAEVVTEASR